MIGNSVPPELEPNARQPNASPFLRLNQCATTATSGPKVKPEKSCSHPLARLPEARRGKVRTPTAKPWQRRNCQYTVHCATSRVETTSPMDAATSGTLRCPRSKSWPTKSPGMNVSAYCSIAVRPRSDSDAGWYAPVWILSMLCTTSEGGAMVSNACTYIVDGDVSLKSVC